MKAYISSSGVLHLVPESQTELYAIQSWRVDSSIPLKDVQRNEVEYYKGTSIKIEQLISLPNGDVCPV